MNLEERNTEKPQKEEFWRGTREDSSFEKIAAEKKPQKRGYCEETMKMRERLQAAARRMDAERKK
jgi:hypothetical protein